MINQNLDVVDWYNSREAIYDALDLKRAELAEVQETVKTLQRQVNAINKINDVIDGVALCKHDFGDVVVINAYDSSVTLRAAEIRKNGDLITIDNTRTDEGIVNHGNNWCDPKSVETLAKRWVALGERPN